MEDDIISMPYEIDAVNDSSKFAVNNSVFFDKFSYDIEDVADNGYIDLKKYASAVDKEALCGLVYRIEGSVFTKVISDDEYAVFKYLRDKKGATLAELKSKFKKVDVLNIVCTWAIDGVIYMMLFVLLPVAMMLVSCNPEDEYLGKLYSKETRNYAIQGLKRLSKDENGKNLIVNMDKTCSKLLKLDQTPEAGVAVLTAGEIGCHQSVDRIGEIVGKCLENTTVQARRHERRSHPIRHRAAA